MKEFKNQYEYACSDCSAKDVPSLMKKAAYLRSKGGLSIQVFQTGKTVQYQGELKADAFLGWFSENFYNGKVFTFKVLVSSPNASLIDPTDRILDVVRADGLRSSPYFFRPDGSPVDLVSIYSGTAFLILNGPSLATIPKLHERLSAPGVISMGVNNGGHHIRPQLWTCVDSPERFMASIWKDPKILKFVPMGSLGKNIPDHAAMAPSYLTVSDCPAVLGYRRNEKFTASSFLSEPTINWGNHSSLGGGRSVMLVAIKLLYLLGFRKIYLLGCDFNMVEERGYFFDEGRSKHAVSNNMATYRMLSERFSELAEVFRAAGLEVLNANPDSALESFPKVTFEQAFSDAAASRWSRSDLTASTRGMYGYPSVSTVRS